MLLFKNVNSLIDLIKFRFKFYRNKLIAIILTIGFAFVWFIDGKDCIESTSRR